MRRESLLGSMWMSDALSVMPREMIMLVRRTTGASPDSSLSCSMVMLSSSPPLSAVIWMLASSRSRMTSETASETLTSVR